MILFGCEHGWGMGYPGDNEVHRLLIFTGENNNVIVQRGYNNNTTTYSINKDDIWDIEEMIYERAELSDAEKSNNEYLSDLDVPEDTFFFINEDGEYRSFSDTMFSCEKGKDPEIDKIIDMIFKIQNILQKNGIDVTILDEQELDYN